MFSIRATAFSLLLFPTAGLADTTATDPAVPPPLPLQSGDGPPPLPPPPAEESFFFVVNGQQQGPLPQSGLTQRIMAGQYVCTGMVWKKGMPKWQPASDVIEFRDVCAAVPPPPPPPTTDWAKFLTGTWVIDGEYAGNRTRTTGTYLPGGRLTGVFELTVSGAAYGLPDQTNTQPFEGKWEVKALARDRFTLTTTIAGADPGKATNSSVLRMTGPNTLYNETVKAPATRISN